MGMSTFVQTFRAPDEEWQKMKAIWDACSVRNFVFQIRGKMEFINEEI